MGHVQSTCLDKNFHNVNLPICNLFPYILYNNSKQLSMCCIGNAFTKKHLYTCTNNCDNTWNLSIVKVQYAHNKKQCPSQDEH